ncbi:mitochondrial NADPH:adrenodoxin oxidoreductase [Favolaschia claudopus]|uniref:Mitochondrial NADPH:adrenodoxin oxidoreductase n=1 Tax=Favolaschia claudopus TaxID=2862362 RepID=A0AAV9ZU03_9AGAR
MEVAIVGGGPSAFYVASRLLLRVHVFDRLWAPHGLVRYGGLPPLPGLSKTVQLGVDDIRQNYSHLVFATGCALPALHAALLNSPWCMPALGFVHWYTQHPSAPPPPALDTLTHVSLIGNGNVALDVARIPSHLRLLCSKSTTSPQPVHEVLPAALTVRHVDIIARRGPINAAFTAKELRELINLPDASMHPIEPSLLVPPDSRHPSAIAHSSTPRQRLSQPLRSTPKTWALEFFKSPIVSASARSPATPFFDATLGHLRTQAGRILDKQGRVLHNVYASGWAANGAKGVLATTMMDAYAVADVVSGDIMNTEQVQISPSEQEFVMNLTPTDDEPPSLVGEACAARRIITYADWKRVDQEEIRRGELLGKERERMDWEAAQAFLWPEECEILIC